MAGKISGMSRILTQAQVPPRVSESKKSDRRPSPEVAAPLHSWAPEEHRAPHPELTEEAYAAARRKPGRKAVDGAVRSERLGFNLTKSEKKELDRYFIREGYATLTECIRDLVRDGMTRPAPFKRR